MFEITIKRCLVNFITTYCHAKTTKRHKNQFKKLLIVMIKLLS